MKLPFYVFSYNRGPFLRHCVDSIKRYSPGSEITIIDDGSNDPETLDILSQYAAHHRVLRQTKDKIAKLGGLYRNLQIALDDFSSGEIFAFVQDDCQIVRNLRPEDDTYILEYFQNYPDAAFLNPHFLKGIRKRGILRAIHLDREFPAYFYDFSERWKDRSVTMYYTDICIGHAPRLRSRGFRFQSDETTTAMHARRLFSKMGTMAYPFVMSLPQVPIYRGKQKTWAVHQAEKRLGTKPKAFEPWSNHESEAFFKRDLQTLPFAEDFLKCSGAPPRVPFVKESVNVFPLLRVLHKVELKARKLLRK